MGAVLVFATIFVVSRVAKALWGRRDNVVVYLLYAVLDTRVRTA